MKKILYSNPFKFIIFFICAILMAFAVNLFTTNFCSKDTIYLFEESYEESFRARELVSDQFHNMAYRLDNTKESEKIEETKSGVLQETTVTESGENTAENVEIVEEIKRLHPEKLSNLPDAKEWEYYIEVNGKVYTNVKDSKGYNDFKNSPLSIGTHHPANTEASGEGFINPGGGYASYSVYSPKDEYTLCVRMPKSVIEANAKEWDVMKARSDNALNTIIVSLFVSLAIFIYLLCVTGKEYGSDKLRMMTIDRMFVEITFALFLTVVIGGPFLMAGLGYEFIITEALPIAHTTVAVVAFATVALALLFLLSMIRNIKNRSFIKRSIICRVFTWCWHWVKVILRFIRRCLISVRNSIKELFGRRAGMIMAALLIVYTLLAAINPVVAVIMIILGCLFLGARMRDLENIKKGVRELKSGNFSNKVEECRSEDYNAIAKDINEIGEGMSLAVEERIKAERMKTDLITNVSHDLKTPLTSIINYADLLSKETLTPAEANDYVKIIKQKSGRLKQLTEDLFDISKVQSGNENFDIEDIDLCLLISQTLAEMDETIKKTGLIFRVSTPDKEVFVKADGKKASRVFENLIGNCVKYSMKNTRVYVDIKNEKGGVRVEIKNIAGYEMDFDENEISERFVRGDSARSSEGSGLGLAIVKSYIEGFGGSMEIKKDGDLFKVVLRFVR